MRFSDPRPRRPRGRVPLVEGLETRELMSTATLSGTSPGAGLASSANLVNSPLIQEFANLLYGPNSPTPMTPTPQELKRQLFTAAWVGKYTVGPPLFFGSGQHDPCLRRLGRLEPVSQGEAQHGALSRPPIRRPHRPLETPLPTR